MDRNLRTILTECIRDLETGASDLSECVERHPDWAAELRAHLSLTRFSPRVSPVVTMEVPTVDRGTPVTPPLWRRTLGWTSPRPRLATG
jgi:hypothetical protein